MKTIIEQKVTQLQDDKYFEFLNGLWIGKKPPFTRAVVIRNTNFRNDGKIDHSNIAVLDVEAKQLEKRKLQKGDIIIERSGGGPYQPVGRVVYFDKDISDIDYSFSNFTSTIRVKDKKSFDSRFVFYFLYNFHLEGKTDQLQRRTTGIRNLDYQAYKESVVFPPMLIVEQKAISRALLTIQEAIAGQEELITKLKELKQNMMQYLFTRGTKGEKTKMTEIGVVPESWDFEKASSFCDSVRDGTHDSPKRKDHGKYLVTSKNIINGKIDFSSCYNVSESDFALVNKRSKVDDNDVIYSMIGTLGEVAFIEKYNNDYCIKNVGLFKNKSQKAGLWLFYWLQSAHAKEYARQNIGGTTQKYLTLAVLRNFPVPIVSEKESNLIVDALNCLDVRLHSEEEKLQVYQKLFKTLLHELMIGERRINI